MIAAALEVEDEDVELHAFNDAAGHMPRQFGQLHHLYLIARPSWPPADRYDALVARMSKFDHGSSEVDLDSTSIDWHLGAR